MVPRLVHMESSLDRIYMKKIAIIFTRHCHYNNSDNYPCDSVEDPELWLANENESLDEAITRLIEQEYSGANAHSLINRIEKDHYTYIQIDFIFDYNEILDSNLGAIEKNELYQKYLNNAKKMIEDKKEKAKNARMEEEKQRYLALKKKFEGT